MTDPIGDCLDFWKGEFGDQYVERCRRSVEELDDTYGALYGVTRAHLNREFFEGRGIRSVLEVGCNIGNQLLSLARLLPDARMTGIEPNAMAGREARRRAGTLRVVRGEGGRLPFRDAAFDLVMTNGVLIHIPPADLPGVMREIARVAKTFVASFEYHAESLIEIAYRGAAGRLWKTDFSAAWCRSCPNLREEKRRLLPYLTPDEAGQVDAMVLLRKA